MRLVEELKYFIFRWKSVFNQSFWNVAGCEFHDLLEIDVAYVIHNPFDFDVINEDAGCHIEVMNYLVGHQIDVLSRFADH
jgi:hypothetical protein